MARHFYKIQLFLLLIYFVFELVKSFFFKRPPLFMNLISMILLLSLFICIVINLYYWVAFKDNNDE